MHILFNFYSLYLLEILIMKKIIFAISVFFILINCQKVKDEGYTINVEAKGGINGLRAYLKTQDYNGSFKIIDSSIILNENLTFKGKLKNPTLSYLFIDNYERKLPLYVENKKIDIELISKDLLNANIKNSPSNTKFKNYLNSISQLTDSLSYYKSLMQKNYFNKEAEQFENNRLKFVNLVKKIQLKNSIFIKNNSDSFLSLSIIQKELITGYFHIDTIYHQYKSLNKKLQFSKEGGDLSDQIRLTKAELSNKLQSINEN